MSRAGKQGSAFVDEASVETLVAGMSDRQQRAVEDAAAVLDAAEFVRELRLRKGLDQKTLARKGGLHEEQISDIERAVGRKGPTIATLARIARASDEQLALVTRAELHALQRLRASREVRRRRRSPAQGRRKAPEVAQELEGQRSVES